ncbi:Uncharacterised protein [Salmonella enterica subsp. enterica serovar Bovismorbificans]|uniref:Uncharacterized protein n=1 Tax=Salmonella enterica subsp. enterica serovar Bovismorbificans TaxID=58097 RepID=A0A655EC80_SALET|nr:Uncharacterised protein [Salmonella enterica subsp. enterica serovar Bovismorbificans]CNU27404.1 Uncharacterised protein [Salmonella enterica subsp. enterica serovar Bovismorbificans]CNU32323.1 Uncharacterised protein [Salmonella enterica subsp. enterica serovar Bovismorbificans]CNV11853.1 Uncharacterised protein [Salmonella enterica subsp. enterica serovar Bovismorbificans]
MTLGRFANRRLTRRAAIANWRDGCRLCRQRRVHRNIVHLLWILRQRIIQIALYFHALLTVSDHR